MRGGREHPGGLQGSPSWRPRIRGEGWAGKGQDLPRTPEGSAPGDPAKHHGNSRRGGKGSGKPQHRPRPRRGSGTALLGARWLPRHRACVPALPPPR